MISIQTAGEQAARGADQFLDALPWRWRTGGLLRLFADRLAKRLESEESGSSLRHVAGHQWRSALDELWKAQQGVERFPLCGWTCRAYGTRALKDPLSIFSAYVAMDQKVITLSRRLPNAERLAWADKLLADMKEKRLNRPRSTPVSPVH